MRVCLTTSVQLCICAIPVFFRIPGIDAFDLGSRTQGTCLNCSFRLGLMFSLGFVTNRRLLLSSSGACRDRDAWGQFADGLLVQTRWDA